MNIFICVRCASGMKEVYSFLDEEMVYSMRRECQCCRDYESLGFDVKVRML